MINVESARILIAESDSRSSAYLQAGLRQAGFEVEAVDDGVRALESLRVERPDVLVVDTRLRSIDGFSLVRKLRERGEWASVGVIFITTQRSVEERIRGLELGVEDFVARPVSAKELAARVQLVVGRKVQDAISGGSLRPPPSVSELDGTLRETGVLELIQSFEAGRKTGYVLVSSRGRHARLAWNAGRLVDAEALTLRGKEAVFRVMLWDDGTFVARFTAVPADDFVRTAPGDLLTEGSRRLEQWAAIRKRLPQSDVPLEANHADLLARLGEIPDEFNAVLRLFDGTRSVDDVVIASPFDDLATLGIVAKLCDERLLLHPTGDVAPAQPVASLRPGRVSAFPTEPTPLPISMRPLPTRLTPKPEPVVESEASGPFSETPSARFRAAPVSHRAPEPPREVEAAPSLARAPYSPVRIPSGGPKEPEPALDAPYRSGPGTLIGMSNEASLMVRRLEEERKAAEAVAASSRAVEASPKAASAPPSPFRLEVEPRPAPAEPVAPAVASPVVTLTPEVPRVAPIASPFAPAPPDEPVLPRSAPPVAPAAPLGATQAWQSPPTSARWVQSASAPPVAPMEAEATQVSVRRSEPLTPVAAPMEVQSSAIAPSVEVAATEVPRPAPAVSSTLVQVAVEPSAPVAPVAHELAHARTLDADEAPKAASGTHPVVATAPHEEHEEEGLPPADQDADRDPLDLDAWSEEGDQDERPIVQRSPKVVVVGIALAAAAAILLLVGIRSMVSKPEIPTAAASGEVRASAAPSTARETVALAPLDSAASSPTAAPSAAPSAAAPVASASATPAPKQPGQPGPANAGGPAPTNPNATLVAEAQKALESGDKARALALARQAAAANPNNAEAWLTLGAAHEANGDKNAAKNAYKSCSSSAQGGGASECKALQGKPQ